MSSREGEEAQANHVVLSCTNERDIVPKQAFKAFASLRIIAPPINQDKRPKLGVTAVIDRSGSMGHGKLELVKRSMHFVLGQLCKEDRLGIIQYDHQEEE
eukprot:TRINITY_DN99655_c0_g1_i1.p1 TRINITY_DN99655_c0_g1~~TRINITY_DN99655_c0_g1_i1.p1  ORF type:complete len:100 (-),score=12.34 TRINITY_DN99655_c0_g1_i1:38-337(-)